MASAEAESEDVLRVQFTPQRSRDLHLIIAGMPIFSERYWQGKDFEASTLEAPLGSGAYKVGRFEAGTLHRVRPRARLLGQGSAGECGPEQFRPHIRYEYFRDRIVAFEAFKNGTLNYNEEYTSRIWATGYDFPAIREGRVKKEEISSDAPATIQGWYFNMRRDTFKDPRIREAIGLAFDFEWTNANIMFGLFKRTTSYFENSDMKAVGKPSPEEAGAAGAVPRQASRFRLRRSRPAARLRRLRPGPAPPAPRGRTFARSRLQARGRHP